MEKKPKICILRWEEGQVLPAQLQLESLPGNSTNPASYPFEIMMVRVKGANMDTIEENPCQEMLDQFIANSIKYCQEKVILIDHVNDYLIKLRGNCM